MNRFEKYRALKRKENIPDSNLMNKIKEQLKTVKLKGLEWKDDKLQIINNGENQKEVNFKTA